MEHFLLADVLSPHQHKDGKSEIPSLPRRCSGGFPSHQRLRGGRPCGVRHHRLRGQQPVQHVLPPQHDERNRQLHQVQSEVLPTGLPEIRPATERPEGKNRPSDHNH